MIHKKILLISPDYPPPLIGGSLVYMNNLIEKFGEEEVKAR